MSTFKVDTNPKVSDEELKQLAKLVGLGVRPMKGDIIRTSTLDTDEALIVEHIDYDLPNNTLIIELGIVGGCTG